MQISQCSVEHSSLNIKPCSIWCGLVCHGAGFGKTGLWYCSLILCGGLACQKPWTIKLCWFGIETVQFRLKGFWVITFSLYKILTCSRDLVLYESYKDAEHMLTWLRRLDGSRAYTGIKCVIVLHMFFTMWCYFLRPAISANKWNPLRFYLFFFGGGEKQEH